MITMMMKSQINELEQLAVLAIERLVPKDQLVRKLVATMNLKKFAT